MSTSKSSGSSRLGRDSAAQRLGIKKYAGQLLDIAKEREEKKMVANKPAAIIVPDNKSGTQVFLVGAAYGRAFVIRKD